MRIKRQRLPERRDGVFVFLFAEVCVTKIAIEYGHIATKLNGPFVSADCFAKLLALVPDGANVILRVRVFRIYLHGLLIRFQRAR